MAWETRNGRGRYYTRSRRHGGKVVREYLGTGAGAELAARMDALDRQELADLKTREAEVDALDASVAAACHAIELLARAALIAAGYRQHDRGEWRHARPSN